MAPERQYTNQTIVLGGCALVIVALFLCTVLARVAGFSSATGAQPTAVPAPDAPTVAPTSTEEDPTAMTAPTATRRTVPTPTVTPLPSPSPTSGPTFTPRPTATPAPPTIPPNRVTREQLGDAWPFTIEWVDLHCTARREVWFLGSDGIRYALNGTARQRADENGWHEIQAIWRPNPNVAGLSIDISPVLERGLALCK